MNKEKKIIDGMAKHITKQAPTASFSIDVADLALDKLLDDSFLVSIPYLNWIVGVKKLYSSISDRIFLGKVAAFLLTLHEKSIDDISQFHSEILSSKKKKRKVAQDLVLLIDRLEDLEKAKFLAYLFLAYIDGKVRYEEFRRFAFFVDKSFTDDILTLLSLDDGFLDLTKDPALNVFEHLHSYGLAYIHWTGGKPTAGITDWGKYLKSIMNEYIENDSLKNK